MYLMHLVQPSTPMVSVSRFLEDVLKPVTERCLDDARYAAIAEIELKSVCACDRLDGA